MIIRSFESRDAQPVATALHQDDLPNPLTAEGVLHWRDAQPERAHAWMWVAEENERVIGWTEARIRWTTSVTDVGDLWVYVVPSARRRRIGTALYAEAERYLLELGARVLESWTYSVAGERLLEAHGFRATGHERISQLDLPQADTSVLPALEKGLGQEGFRLAPLAQVLDRVEALHRVYADASADVPEYFKEDDVRLDEWCRETLEHPQLTHEGSFVALAGDVPAALAFVEVDQPARMAANEMTGTLVEYRRRGLARLVKLASIRWAKEQGFEIMLTGNAESNAAMLGLNQSLGYRPLVRETHYVRDDLS
jgi:GNAT superfamily N-acetyltransferase